MDSRSSSLLSSVLCSNSPAFSKLAETQPCPKKEEDLKKLLPITRYYGSKLRLVNWISNVVRDLKYQTVLDAFGGTGTVSLLFRAHNKDVTYNDILFSNFYSAQALLSAHSPKYRKGEIPNFLKNVTPNHGFIYDTFSGYYYTDEENAWLDGVAKAIHRIRDPQYKTDLLYCLFQACLQKRPFNLFHRKNLYIRTNNNKNTKFGNWRTWERSFEELILRAANQLSRAKSINTGTSTVLPPSDASLLPSKYDLVYIDPPYIKNSNNALHYIDRYHFLEGLSNYSEWKNMINYQSKLLTLKPNKSTTDWNHKNTSRERLFDMIDNHSKSIVALSYAEGGYPPLDELTRHFKQTFNNVAIFRNTLSHALRKSKSREIIILGAN
jgi:adenine-specific DNA-methyltransferase